MAKKIFTSALGTAEPYAYIAKPDYGNEERGFGNPRGVYKVDLTIPNKDPRCQRMVDEIVKCHEEAYAAAVEEYEANPPAVARGKKPLKPYEGDMPFFDNGDGTTTFKFKCYASFQDKKTKETKHINLVVVDSKGKKIEDVPIIGGGSKLKVKYSLPLVAVKTIGPMKSKRTAMLPLVLPNRANHATKKAGTKTTKGPRKQTKTEMSKWLAHTLRVVSERSGHSVPA